MANEPPQGDSASDERFLNRALDATESVEEDQTETQTAPPHSPRRTEGPGSVIGRYKLLQKIGEGGFGVVYMAEQKQPVKRKVALKIIKLGMDTKQVIARFEAERQALAMMDHPNIARVLDAGATDTGRPFFVMELVKGVPFTEYCDTESLPTRDRLLLFIAVSRAVQHAHQKGIIHRDLKPSNVMITLHDGKPVPKVIDFGIAKATNRDLTDKTLFTEYHQLIGTPAYMSPEQAEMSGLDLDTRSDIYSLGVLLYELLTGTTPFDSKRFRGMGPAQIQQVIRDEEPHKPSTRLSEMSRGRITPGKEQTESASSKTSIQYITKHRRTDITSLRREISGDLDWIIMKCLEKDRARRYETANGLARDVERYLNDEPVAAGPPGASYRLKKTIRRNKAAFVTALLVLLLLVGGVIGTTVGLVRARRSQAKSEQVAIFMTEMLEGAGPSVALGRDTTMLREILDETAKRVGKELADQPDVQATIRNTLGITYRELGEYPAAELHLRKALDLRKQYFGDEHEKVAESLVGLGGLLLEKGEYDESESLVRASLAMRRELLGSEHAKVAESMNELATVLTYKGDYDNAEPLFRESLAISRKLLGDDHPNTLISINDMGRLLEDRGKFAEAEPYLREALEGRRRVLGDDHPDTHTSINDMGLLLDELGRYDEAMPYVRESLEGNRRVLGDDHPNTLTSIGNMGYLLQTQGKLEEAEPYFRESLEGSRRVLGDEHPNTLGSINNMGALLNELGRHDDAAEVLLACEAAARRVYVGGNAKWLGNFLAKLGEARTGQGRFTEGEKVLIEAHGLLADGFGDDQARTTKTVKRIVKLYDAWHAAEPGKGYDEKAAEWHAKLPKETETKKP